MNYDKASFLSGLAVGRQLKGWSVIDSGGGGGGGGGGGTGPNDVIFYDYDGSIVASYSASDFASLSAMPDNPSHDGLTAQGWNWTLADAKSYVAAYGKLNIGQMYITSDGKTRIYIHLEDGRLSPMLGVCPDGTVTVDWGDNTATDTLTGTSVTTVQWTPNHPYAAAGDYVVTLTVNGSMGFAGASTGSYLLRYSSSSDASRNRAYRNAIQHIQIGNGVTVVGSYAFRECYSLASITIPNGVTSIDDFAFYQCSSLASITIPDGVTTIPNNAFYYSYSLASITIPDGVTSIGMAAFFQCSSLASITIPNGVTFIDDSTFFQCSSLANVAIPNSVTGVGDSAFQYCYSLASITIPNSVTWIGDSTFRECYSLANVTIPNSVTSISGRAFQGCSSLASITISDGVTTVPTYAFYACYSLANVTIPNSVTGVVAYAFYNCHSLGNIKFTSTTPPTVGVNVWTNVPTDCIIYVPAGSLAAYTSAANYPNSNTYTYVEY